MTEIITDRKDQYEYNLMKCCILPTCLWFILSSESTKAATHLAVLVPEVQSTGSMQPFGNSSNKSKSVLWRSTLHLAISEYLIPLSRMYRALCHKWSQQKSSEMLHTMNRQLRVWAGYNMHNMLRGWTQPYSHIGKGNVWSAELLPGLYWLHCLVLHCVKKVV